MSVEFIKAQVNKSSIHEAAKQERQIAYFTQNTLQDDFISQEYLEQWANRNYNTNDYFLNYIKSVFKTENFLFFFKYLRKPIPSAKLINNKIKPQLNRVFVAENADFKYDVTNVDKGEIHETLKPNQFEEELFEKMIYNHNSILIEDMSSDEANEPYRYYINIEDVVSLNHNNKRITQIAFPGCIVFEDEKIDGYIYIDDEFYRFYDKSFELRTEEPHDLGKCPADFIVKQTYNDDFIIRQSIFTYIREELEEYVFLKTLQKMTDPNGAIPVVSKLDVPTQESDIKGSNGEPVSNEVMGSQRPEVYNEVNNKQTGELQAGTIHGIPLEAVMADDGTVNMDLVTNYLNFFRTPVDALNYIRERINEVENSIISTLIGTIDTSNEEAKNQLQIEKSIIVLENTLILFANNMNYIRTESDYKMLALKYGVERVNEVFIFYGTDFFLESRTQLFKDLEIAPNPIERKNILVRINQNRYKGNQDQMLRQKILYDLLPFVADVDYDKAKASGIDPIIDQYYLRFTYWIGLFEAEYGDVVTFYQDQEGSEANKMRVINDLILDIIKSQQPEQPIQQETNN